MRLHVGTKIGKKSYIGVSGNPEKAAAGCFKAFFVWPFLLIYYISIWPFVALARWLKNRLAHTGEPGSTSAVKATPARQKTDWRNVKAWKWWQWGASGLAALYAIGIIGGIGGSSSGEEIVPSPAPVVAIAATEKQQPEETALTIQPTVSPTAAPTAPSRVTEAAPTANPVKSINTPAPTEVSAPTPAPEQEEDSPGRTIYGTETGKKYHYDNNCNDGTYFEITWDKAQRLGLEPCGKCVLQ